MAWRSRCLAWWPHPRPGGGAKQNFCNSRPLGGYTHPSSATWLRSSGSPSYPPPHPSLSNSSVLSPGPVLFQVSRSRASAAPPKSGEPLAFLTLATLAKPLCSLKSPLPRHRPAAGWRQGQLGNRPQPPPRLSDRAGCWGASTSSS